MLARYLSKYVNHVSTLPTQARHLRKHTTNATHASTNSTPFLKLHERLCFKKNTNYLFKALLKQITSFYNKEDKSFVIT